MNTAAVKMLSLVSGIILIFAGVLAVFSTVDTILGFTLVFGLAMLVRGGCEIAAYFFSKEVLYGASWMFSNGLLTLVLSVLILAGRIQQIQVIPYVYGMWVLFSGIMYIVWSAGLKKFKVKGWHRMGSLAACSIVLGCVSFFTAALPIFSPSGILAAALILQGASALFFSWFLPHLKLD